MKQNEQKKAVKVSDLMKRRKDAKPIDYNGDLIELLKERPLSYSSVKHFLNSPWHFWNYYFGDKPPTTAALDKGKLFEMMLLEPDKVDENIVVYPHYNLRKPDDRAEKELFEQSEKEKNPDVLLVKEEELVESLNMYERAIKDPEVKEWLDSIVAIQETLYYTDPTTKLRCVSKIDARTSLDENPLWITDLKSGISAHPNDWQRSVINFDYWLQMGGYCYAYQTAYFTYPEYQWLVVENKAPYSINFIKADRAMIDESVRIWKSAIQAVNFAIENKHFDKSHKFWRIFSPYDILYMPRWFKSRF